MKEIIFPSDTVERKKWFTGQSFAHPAKMILGLQTYLIEHYTKPGDWILDPMAGSGTILFACTLGRNVICVELEDKFIKMQQANWQKIKAKGPMLGHTMGTAQIIQGDARQLPEVLADTCIFSPPYAEAQLSSESILNKYPELKGKGGGIITGSYHNGKGDNPSNIGNLKYGEIDKVISGEKINNNVDKVIMPCYNTVYENENRRTETKTAGKKSSSSQGVCEAVEKSEAGNKTSLSGYKPVTTTGSRLLSNRAILPLENSKDIKNTEQKQGTQGEGTSRVQGRIEQRIISQEHNEGKVRDLQQDRKSGDTSQGLRPLQQQTGKSTSAVRGLSYPSPQEGVVGRKENGQAISQQCPDKMGQVNCICCSPPYSETSQRGGDSNKDWSEIIPKLGSKHGCKWDGYSKSKDNIGNLKNDNYLQAMLQVYQNCHKVLKNNGLLILVTKNFIRNKKIVRLDTDTIKLCQKAGFKLIEQLKRKLTQQSFWRIIYYKKFPNAPKITHENILIFQKSPSKN